MTFDPLHELAFFDEGYNEASAADNLQPLRANRYELNATLHCFYVRSVSHGRSLAPLDEPKRVHHIGRQMQPLPAIIKKHWIGYVAILGAGLGVTALLWGLIYSLRQSGQVDDTGALMLLFASVIVLLITIVQIWVYSISYIEITEETLHVVNWRTLFVKQDVITQWSRVQDAGVATGSLWALLFDYGHLTVQTAGTAQELNMTMIPSAEYWQAIITAEIAEG